MCLSVSVCMCACMQACQLSNNQGIKVGNQMEEKRGKIKYLPHTYKRMGGKTVTTQRMEPQVVDSCGQLNLLMTAVIPEL